MQFLDVMELFSTPTIAPLVSENSMCLDLTSGWNLFSREDRIRAWRYICYFKPVVVILSPECKGFSNVMNANWSKMSDDHVEYVQDTCLAMWLFSIQVAIHQDNHGRFYVLEQPHGASSWILETTQTLHSRPGCELLRVDQCMFGLIVDPSGELLSRKGSGV